MAKPALGRGWGALRAATSSAAKRAPNATETATHVPVAPALAGGEQVQRVALGRIYPCAFQPRKDFPEDTLRELADSIREKGVVQPLIVRARGDRFELIAGERRWRAAQLCGLAEVPVLVREADDAAVLELALIENLQRENLNPIEEAQGYQQLIDQFQLRQEDVATKVGKGRVVVANALRLLRLPSELQTWVRNGRLSVGHAKALLGLTSAEEQRLAADRIVRGNLNVRQTEELVSAMQRQASSAGGPKAGVSDKRLPPDVHLTAMANRLQERFGTKVQLRYRHGKGAVQISFFSDAELERILEVAGVSLD